MNTEIPTMFYNLYLKGLCDRRVWPEPIYKVQGTRDGYTCTVKVNQREYSTDVAFETEELAKNAAATRAYLICRNFSVNNAVTFADGKCIIQGIPVAINSRKGSDACSLPGSDKASTSSFHTATSKPKIERTQDRQSQAFMTITPWQEHLQAHKLIPDKFDETDWSGRGQHAEFDASEFDTLASILEPRGILGYSATTLVEKVQCRRIMLARKRIKCNWRLKRENAIKEVGHLQRLQHSHIVRGVGTYVLDNELSILLYPAAEHNLESFLDMCADLVAIQSPTAEQMNTYHGLMRELQGFFGCLVNTLAFVHGHLVKHMDIKPSNLLIKSRPNGNPKYKIYLADFGISRSYDDAADAETESRTAFTKTYAAPEVVLQEKRVFGADVYSLGCVFLEMLTIFSLPVQRHALLEVRRANPTGDWSYQANMQRILESPPFQKTEFFGDQCPACIKNSSATYLRRAMYEAAKEMVREDAMVRPSAGSLKRQFGEGLKCCYEGAEPFEAASSTT